jgi:uncharacterized repeat protein (TIGR02543 family)
MSGYAFGGWYTQQYGDGTHFTADTPVIAEITVYAKWLPSGSVHIQLQPVTVDPPLLNTTLFVDESVPFSVDSGYASYQWYWDGAAISDATSADYTLESDSKTRGVYELSVVVTTDDGEWLSARCRITIKAH